MRRYFCYCSLYFVPHLIHRIGYKDLALATLFKFLP